MLKISRQKHIATTLIERYKIEHFIMKAYKTAKAEQCARQAGQTVLDSVSPTVPL